MTRLLVLLGRGEHADEDQLFRTFIGRELTKRRVAVVIAAVSEATLHQPQPLRATELADQHRALRVLEPEALLRISETRVMGDANRPHRRMKIVYEVELHLLSPAGIGQRVWRAALEHGGPEPHMEKRFMLAAACLMERLDADGVLAPRRDDQ